MRRTFAIAVWTLLAALALPLAAAVAEEHETLRIDAVELGDHPEVRFSLSVPAHPDGPRPSDAFTVMEDGAERPVDVRQAESADLQVLLLIDTTGSMGGAPIEDAKAAASTFVERLPGDTSIAVLNYDTEATVVTDFDASRDEHLAGIGGLVAGGRTAMYDAVGTAVEVFPKADERTERIIVLLTDGEDNASETTVDDAIEALQANDVTLHSIEYLTAFTDEAAIREMANATGGTVSEADDAAGLTRVYEDLAAALVNRYTLSYLSEASGEVELTVSVDHDGFQASGSRSVTLPDLSDAIEEPLEDPEEASEQDAAVTPPAAAEPPTIPPSEASTLGRIALFTGAGLWFLALTLVVLVWFAPRQVRTRLAGATERFGAGKRGLSELTNRATLFAERSLERRGRSGGLNAALERAGIDLRPGEFLVLVASAAVTAIAVGTVLNGLLVGLFLAVVTLIAARLIVSLLIDRRQRRFADQLGETLQLLSGSLRAGYSMMQAVDSVAREADSPAAEEFGRLVVETRLGRDMSDAMRAMAERVQCEDFEWVIQAIEIHREVGGDLAEVLDTVAETIRERNQIRRQVKALSAEGRLSAYVLLALPFGVGFFIYLTNRPYLAELTDGGLLGWGLIGTGLVLMTIGVIWMRKLVRLVY